MSITNSTEKSVEQVIAHAVGATFTFAKPPVFGRRGIRHHSHSSYQNHLFSPQSPINSLPILSPLTLYISPLYKNIKPKNFPSIKFFHSLFNSLSII